VATLYDNSDELLEKKTILTCEGQGHSKTNQLVPLAVVSNHSIKLHKHLISSFLSIPVNRQTETQVKT